VQLFACVTVPRQDRLDNITILFRLLLSTDVLQAVCSSSRGRHTLTTDHPEEARTLQLKAALVSASDHDHGDLLFGFGWTFLTV